MTHASILRTKLAPPLPHDSIVSRPRLFAILDHAAQRRVTLLAAPAGSGKTTLISSWLQAVQQGSGNREQGTGAFGAQNTARERSIGSIAWVSLDAQDNAPLRFWSHLFAAVETALPGIGTAILDMSPTTPDSNIDRALTALLNDVATCTEPLILVLNDLHVVTAPAIYHVLSQMIDHMPPQMRLILISRINPPLPLARWRAHGDLTELRIDRLRFTVDETSQLLNETLQLGLNQGDIIALTERTEGWVVGLRLAALSLHGGAKPSSVIAGLNGNDRFILDYLVDEVLSRQPDSLQQFLIQTAILDRLHADLCEAVTGRADSYTLLEDVERANLFLVPLDRERYWYRYQQLFADVLRARLLRTAPREVVELHRRAAQWYMERSMFLDAGPHVVATEDTELMVTLLQESGVTLLDRGDVSLLKEWFGALPKKEIRTRPRLCLIYAWMLITMNKPDTVEQWLDRASVAVSSNVDRDTFANERAENAIAFTRAVLRSLPMSTGGLPDAPSLTVDQIPTFLPSSIRRIASWALSYSFIAGGKPIEALRALEQADVTYSDAEWPYRAARPHGVFVHLAVLRGELIEADRICTHALAEATTISQPLAPVMSLLYSGMAMIRYEQNDLTAAERYAREGVELAQKWENPFVVFQSWMILARVQRAQGVLDEAQASLTRAEGADTVMSWLGMLWASEQIQIDLASGNLAVAQKHTVLLTGWSGAEHVHPLPPWYYMADLTLARVALLSERSADAIAILERLMCVVEAEGWWYILIEALALYALALQAQGDPETAQQNLLRALTLAEPQGYKWIFLDPTLPTQPLLRRVYARLNNGSAGSAPAGLSDYVSALLPAAQQTSLLAQSDGDLPRDGRKMEDRRQPRYNGTLVGMSNVPGDVVMAPGTNHNHAATVEMIEPLSEREYAVLRLLESGMSNQDIADALIVSVATVKKHLLSIYGKLNVHNRTQAVATARALQLL
jgi:LuxR family maltose regulon positive regulatory protein